MSSNGFPLLQLKNKKECTLNILQKLKKKKAAKPSLYYLFLPIGLQRLQRRVKVQRVAIEGRTEDLVCKWGHRNKNLKLKIS